MTLKYIKGWCNHTPVFIKDPPTEKLMMQILAVIQRQAKPTLDRLMHVVKIRGYIRNWDSAENLFLLRFHMGIIGKPWTFNKQESWMQDPEMMFAVAQLCKQSFRYPYKLYAMPEDEREEVHDAMRGKRWLSAREHAEKDKRVKQLLLASKSPVCKMRLPRYII